MKKILKFYSESCGPCKVMTNTLKKLPPEIEVQSIETSIDANSDLVDTYKIRSIPTIIVVNEGGIPVKEFRGITPIEDILKAIEE